MSPAQRNFEHVASELRATFDASFATAHAADPPTELDLLEIRVGEHSYALRLSQLLAVHVDRKLVPAPGPRRELLGLAGMRGVVAPVYDLRMLLGYPSGTPPRFLAQVRAPTPFAVAFEFFERHLRVAESDVTLGGTTADTTHPFAPGSVKRASGLLPVIDLLAILQEVTSSLRRPSAPVREERP